MDDDVVVFIGILLLTVVLFGKEGVGSGCICD
jgi:hypothetical protein